MIARYLEERQWESYEIPSELIETENIIIKGYLPVDERLQSRLDCFQKRLAGLGSIFPAAWPTCPWRKLLKQIGLLPGKPTTNPKK